MIGMGRSVPDVAQSSGIGANLIYQWITRASKKLSVTPSAIDIVFDEQKAVMQSASGSWRWNVIF